MGPDTDKRRAKLLEAPKTRDDWYMKRREGTFNALQSLLCKETDNISQSLELLAKICGITFSSMKQVRRGGIHLKDSSIANLNKSLDALRKNTKLDSTKLAFLEGLDLVLLKKDPSAPKFDTVKKSGSASVALNNGPDVLVLPSRDNLLPPSDDEGNKPVTVRAGTRDITVNMDRNDSISISVQRDGVLSILVGPTRPKDIEVLPIK